MKFRFSNNVSWAEEFSADSLGQFTRYVRGWLRDHLQTYRDEPVHPLIALRRRLQEIDQWERERIARPGTEHLHATWHAQASTWRYGARHTAGVDRRVSIQVWDGRYWVGLGYPAIDFWVAWSDDPAKLRQAWDQAAVELRRADQFRELADFAADALQPTLRIVPVDAGNSGNLWTKAGSSPPGNRDYT